MKLKLDSIKFGLSGGIIGAIIVFLTTINGFFGFSKAYLILQATIWTKFGYTLTLPGLLIGTILGFIYGLIICSVFALIYNKLIS